MRFALLVVTALPLLACTEAAAPTAPRSPVSMPDVKSDGLASYRYAFVNAAFQCSPDWGQEAPHVDVFLSEIFGFCTSYDPRAAINGRLAARARSECAGDSRLLFESVDAHDDRQSAKIARSDRWYQASTAGSEVHDLDFVSALPRGACE